MTFYKQRNLHDEPWQEDVEDLVCPADAAAPGINKDCKLPGRVELPWYTPDHLDFPLFVGKGRPTTPLPPFLFSSDPRNRGTHTHSLSGIRGPEYPLLVLWIPLHPTETVYVLRNSPLLGTNPLAFV